MKLTPEQERAAFAAGSVTVRAGAGTGKTQMLTQRYLHHLTTGALRPLEVVAVTFTERAAAELRARIRSAVLTHVHLPKDYALEVEAAQISTIHALAARVCREHPTEADVPPDFAILDELEGSIWLAEHCDDALSALPAHVVTALPYATLRDCIAELLKEPDAAEAALAVGHEGWPDLARSHQQRALARLLALSGWRDACSVLTRYQGEGGDKREVARQHALACVRALESGAVKEAIAHLARTNLQGGKKSAWPNGGLDEVKGAIFTARDCLSAAIEEGLDLELGPADEHLAARLVALTEAFTAVWAHLRRVKRAARVLDYADLLSYARQALAHPHVREHYAGMWRAFLIDEVQDTSPAQANLLLGLSAHATVTIVGDEKQSIYGFLGADETVFARMQEHVTTTGGSTVTLSDSFRTHASLMSALNTLTSPLLGEMNQPLIATRAAPSDGPHVTAYAVTCDDRANKPQRQVTEARHLAALIQRLIDERVPIYDKDSAEHRPVELRDIAVLTRVWKPLEAYSEVLPALGVNAMHSGGGNLLETREAKDCFAALSFLADSSDNLALAAVLRSPHAAWSDRALARVARATPKEGSWWETLKANPPEEGVEVVLALDALVHARRKFAPSRLLQMLDSLTGYTAVIRNLPGGVRREADYRAFLQLLRQLEPGSDLFTVTRRVRRLVQADAAVPRPALQATDAVTLMTIHRAKGLEWPVVILADLDYRPGNTTPSLLLDPGLGVAMKVEGEDGQSVEPFVYKLLKRQQAAREAQELKRVLYVGLTRTRDHLYLSATDSKGGALDALLPCLDAAACAINGVPHTSETSAYPQHAEPQAHAVRDVGDLWRREVANLGKAAAFVEPKFLPKEQRVVPDGWRDAISLFEMSEEHRWLPLLEALQAAGVPAPHLDGCLTFLEDDPGTTVLLVWHDVRLVEEGTLRRPGVANVVLVTAADPHASTRNVLRHLGLAA